MVIDPMAQHIWYRLPVVNLHMSPRCSHLVGFDLFHIGCLGFALQSKNNLNDQIMHIQTEDDVRQIIHEARVVIS